MAGIYTRRKALGETDDDAEAEDDTSDLDTVGGEDTAMKTDSAQDKRFQGLDAENIETAKTEIRQLSIFLRNEFGIFGRKFYEEDIAFERIDEGSMMINKKEERMGFYLSMIVKNERVFGRYAKIHRNKERYNQKLIEVTTVWLQMFNPHCIEIASYNRAKTLAETLVHVFEGEWRELYVSSKKKLVSKATDRSIIECLRDTLRYCYSRCQDIAMRQCVAMLHLLTMSSRYNIDNCPAVIRLRIKQLQINTSVHTLPFIQKTVRDAILSEISLRTITRVQNTQKPPFRTFLDLCTEVMWLMQVQDPPVILDFTGEDGIKRYKSYTTSGRALDFVVWPAIMLYAHGPIVSKGVAEFADNEPSDSNTSNSQQMTSGK